MKRALITLLVVLASILLYDRIVLGGGMVNEFKIGEGNSTGIDYYSVTLNGQSYILARQSCHDGYRISLIKDASK
jgi:hypothetical protein